MQAKIDSMRAKQKAAGIDEKCVSFTVLNNQMFSLACSRQQS